MEECVYLFKVTASHDNGEGKQEFVYLLRFFNTFIEDFSPFFKISFVIIYSHFLIYCSLVLYM